VHPVRALSSPRSSSREIPHGPLPAGGHVVPDATPVTHPVRTGPESCTMEGVLHTLAFHAATIEVGLVSVGSAGLRL